MFGCCLYAKPSYIGSDLQDPASGSCIHQAGSELMVDQESSQQIFGKPDPVSDYQSM
jgi:hypothetical protein